LYLAEKEVLRHKIKLLDGLIAAMKREMLTLQAAFAVLRASEPEEEYSSGNVRMAEEEIAPTTSDTKDSAFVSDFTSSIDFVIKHSNVEGIFEQLPVK
jgi:hypothetical protein